MLTDHYAVLTLEQSVLLDQVSQFVMDAQMKQLKITNDMPARDRAFVSKLGDELRLGVAWDGWETRADGDEVNVVVFTKPGRRSTPGAAVVGMRDSGDGVEEATAVDPDIVPVDDDEEAHPPDSEDSEEEEESRAAIMRVLDKYARAPVQQEKTADERAGDEDRQMEERMDEWRWEYYRVSRYAFLEPGGTHVCLGETWVQNAGGVGRPCTQLHRGSAVGDVLLLSRSAELGLVLQVPLCAQDWGYVVHYT